MSALPSPACHLSRQLRGLCALVAGLLIACGVLGRVALAAPRPTYDAPPPAQDVSKLEALEAVVFTDRGEFVMRFYPKEAPQTVSAFVKLAQDGFYDGLTFHRVVPGFVVQTGDPTGTGRGGAGFTLPAEFNGHKHTRGAAGIARTQDPDSGGSQFYICLDDARELDRQYTVFARVVSGMENVDKIKKGDHVVRIEIRAKGASPSSPSPTP